MKIVYKPILLIAAFMFTGLAGCKKVLEKPPLTSITSVNYFKNGDDAESAIIGCYDALQDPLYYGASIFIMGELPSDNAYTLNPDILDVDQVRWTATSVFTVGLYQSMFIAVNRTNSVIKYVPNITANISETRKNQILGEAHFLRALHYFNLLRCFGGIPLHLEPTESEKQSAMARSTPEQVYAQIENDLSFAEGVLPNSFGNQALDRTRVTKGAVNALQAKVFLYERKWDQSVTAAKKVIANSNYGTLTTPWNNLFPFKNKQESILEVQFEGSADGGSTLPDENLPTPPATYSYPKFDVPTAELMSYVDTLNDNRWKRVGPVLGGISFGSAILASSANANDNGWFIYKWHSGNFFSSLDNSPVLILDDVYLIEAEASNEQNGPNQDALDKLNAIRTRAGLPLATLTGLNSKSAFRDEVDKQRRLELAFVGERWYDLVRYAKQTIADPSAVHKIDALTIIKQFRGKADPNYFVFAIPLGELNTNPLIKQNPGF